MALLQFSIFDKKAGKYGSPFTCIDQTDAQRQMIRASMDERTNLFHFSADFELFYLGEFDERSGKFHPLENPEFIGSVSEFQQLAQAYEKSKNIPVTQEPLKKS